MFYMNIHVLIEILFSYKHARKMIYGEKKHKKSLTLGLSQFNLPITQLFFS